MSEEQIPENDVIKSFIETGNIHPIHQAEIFGIYGMQVGVSLLQEDNPVGLAMMNVLQTERVARHIENISAEKPDSREELKQLAGGMKVNPPDYDTHAIPDILGASGLRYGVVDISTEPIRPTPAFLELLNKQSVNGKRSEINLDHKPAEGISMGTVSFFRDEPERVRQIGYDPDELRNPQAPEGPDNPPKKLFLEIAYYHMDDLNAQMPYLATMKNSSGDVQLTPFQQGIFLAINDVLRKAKVLGYEPQDVVIAGYADLDNIGSERVMRTLGFKRMDDVPIYDEDYPHPRSHFVLGGDKWSDFTRVYDEIISPETKHVFAETSLPNEQYYVEPVPDSLFSIPIARMIPVDKSFDDGIEIKGNLPPPEYFDIDIYPAEIQEKPYESSDANDLWNTRRIDSAEKNYEAFHKAAESVIDRIYQQVFMVQQGDRMAILIDSSTALDVVKAVALRGAGNESIHSVDLIYMRTQSQDDVRVPVDWLKRELRDAKIAISSFDMLSTREEYARGITEFYNGQYSFSISFQCDDYQIRFNKLAEISKRFGPQALIPGITLQEMTSDVFSADRHEMVARAAEFKELMNGAREVHIYGDGDNRTDFTYYPSTGWVSEAENIFSTRRDERKDNKQKLHVSDNLPAGEVWTYLPKTEEKKSHGTITVRLLDTAISAELVKLQLLTDAEIPAFNYDAADPIVLDIQDGYVVGITGGHRAELLRIYFDHIQKENDEHPVADNHWPSLWVAEPGAGINEKVSGVETGTLSTLCSEKELYILHFGIGNNYDPEEPSETQAKSHLDLSLRGQKMTMDILLEDGSIRRVISDEAGRVNYGQYTRIPAKQ